MGDRERQGNFIAQAWLVILLALLYGGGLAVVQTALSSKIAENIRNETYRVIPVLVAGADQAMTIEQVVRGENDKKALVYRAMGPEGEHVGWVVPAGGQGFADRIEVLIGLDATASTITGLYVLEQKETPGLGDYITGEEFRGRFRDRRTDEPLVVVKSDAGVPNEILALTGATISSESVSGIVNAALSNLRETLRKESLSPDPEDEAPIEAGNEQKE